MSDEYGKFEAINGGIANDLIKERDKYKTLWNNLKDYLELGTLYADGDWDTSIVEQILKDMKVEEEKVR